MNVLFLSDNPTLGGTIRILQGWLPLAASRGVASHVVVRPHSLFANWLAAHEVSYTTNPMPTPSLRWPVHAVAAAWRLAWWARQRRIDVVHCNEHNIYPFGLVLRRFLPVPIVCHVRYKVSREFCEWAFRGRRQPSALLWTSDQQRRDCAEAVRGIVSDDRQMVVRLGLDLDRFGSRADARLATRRAWGVGDDQIVIGQACAFRARKRIEDFVDLVADLARLDDRVVGVLAGGDVSGEEGYRTTILRRVAESGLGNRLRLIGNLDDVEPFYQGIDLFVSTSEYETFGNSVCEAMACGRPIVAYAGGSVAEVVGDTGRVVPTGDLPALKVAARAYVTDAEARAAAGRRSRERVALAFNPAHSLDQLYDLYTSLCRQPADTARP
jgi:glycosyltransferase involved in cell wall biosynthesis